MLKAPEGRRTKESGNSALTQVSGKTPLLEPEGCPSKEKRRHVLISSNFEEALAQVHNLGALIWAAGETEEPDLKDSFIDLMNMPLQRLMEELKKLEEDL